MRLNEVDAHKIELAQLTQGADEDVLERAVAGKPESLLLHGRAFPTYYSQVQEEVESIIDEEYAEDEEFSYEMTNCEVKELYYHPKNKSVFMRIEAEGDVNDESGRDTDVTRIDQLIIQFSKGGRCTVYDHSKMDKDHKLKWTGGGKPPRSDDDIDLLKVLPASFLAKEWTERYWP